MLDEEEGRSDVALTSQNGRFLKMWIVKKQRAKSDSRARGKKKKERGEDKLSKESSRL